MDAVRETAGGQVAERLLEIFEVVADRLPTVDHQEHVAVRRIARLAPPTPFAVRRHAVDTVLRETLLPLGDDPEQLDHGSPYGVGVLAARDRSDVGQIAQAGQQSAAEVEAVELHFLGVWVSARPVMIPASAVLFPVCGAPATAT